MTMSSTAAIGKSYLCTQCDRPESKCICERYCCLCQSQFGIRLCEDGLLYCTACREACGHKASE
jgi:hypothetical protein